MKRISIIALLLLLAGAGHTFAQVLSYQAYIDLVQHRNVELHSQRLSTRIAEAEIRSARATDDPTLSVEYGNNSDWSMLMGQSASAELSKPLAPGKRMARVAVAKKGYALSQAEFDDFWRNLRADATIEFYDALLAKEMLAIGTRAYANIVSLAHSDSIRFVRGEISEIDMLQSRLEQARTQQELSRRRTDYRNALVLLDERCGDPSAGTADVEGSLQLPSALYSLNDLISQALANRADMRAAQCEKDLAVEEEHLALRERRGDVELALSASYNTRVRNEEAPAPEFMGYAVGLSIPLPSTSVNRGVRQASQLRIQQADLKSQLVGTTIRAEVIRAYNSYQAALSRANAFAGNMMSNAQQVLDGKLYAYQRGDTSLLEVLLAQETFNEIQEELAQCLYDCMVALVELQRAAGE